MTSTTEQRSLFDWGLFTIIHLILIGAVGYAGFYVYGAHLGLWVAASATIAGLISTYLFAKIVLELASGIVIFSISSKRLAVVERHAQTRTANPWPHEITVGK